MARIAIGVCGEGRGHAARALTLLERLGERHEFLVASTDEALALLAGRARAARPAARFLDVPGIRFDYVRGRIDVSRSIAAGLWYRWRRLPALLDHVTRALDDFGPDIVITDFEPVLPRAARRLNIPVVSVDHQHFLLAYDLRELPRGLRWQATAMGLAVRLYVRAAADTVVSAFFQPPLARGWEHVVQVARCCAGRCSPPSRPRAATLSATFAATRPPRCSRPSRLRRDGWTGRATCYG